ncbi:MAG: hypothetical protein AAFP17_02500 [Pseudomonadota bacterium]
MKKLKLIAAGAGLALFISIASAFAGDSASPESSVACEDIFGEDLKKAIKDARDTGRFGNAWEIFHRRLVGASCTPEAIVSFIYFAGYNAHEEFVREETKDQPAFIAVKACRKTRRLSTLFQLKCFDQILFRIVRGKIVTVHIMEPKLF